MGQINSPRRGRENFYGIETRMAKRHGHPKPHEPQELLIKTTRTPGNSDTGSRRGSALPKWGHKFGTRGEGLLGKKEGRRSKS